MGALNTIVRGAQCGNLKDYSAATRGWVPKFATGIYIIVENASMLNFLTRLDYKHKK